MTLDQLMRILIQNGIGIASQKPIDHATQIKLYNGVTINAYHTGKILVQGKKDLADPVRALVCHMPEVKKDSPKTAHSTPAAEEITRLTPELIDALLDSIPPELRTEPKPRHPEWCDHPSAEMMPF